MLALLLTVALGQQLGPCGPEGPILCGGSPYALFEFAPASGAGLTAPCACSAVTGAKGETLTLTRASSATCLKGPTLTGIQNGDLVTCSTDQPRVMPGGDGTGTAGLLVEGERTNRLLRSEESENAAYTNHASGVAAPTVTADQAVAPDGASTADRWQIPATTAAQYSTRYQGLSLAGAASAAVFLKGNGQSGTVDLCLYDNGAASYVCTACAYVAASWSRCALNNVPSGAANATWLFGNASLQNGGTARGAQDFFFWGGQWEVGAFCSSYIKTEGSSVQRAGELAYVSLAGFPASSTYSLALTAVVGGGVPADGIFAEPWLDANNLYELYRDSSARLKQYVLVGGGNKGDTFGATPVTVPLNATSRLVQTYGGGTSGSVCVDGACSTTTLTAFTPLSGTLRFYLGGHHIPASVESYAVHRRVCFDPSETRCR